MPDSVCNVLERIVPYRTQQSGSDDHGHNTNDSATGSLRQAIADVVNGDTINFDSSLNGQTITLTTGELLVNKNITINGPGSDNLIVDGNHASRVFHVSRWITATISGLTIANGDAGVDHGGGGIQNDHATLLVDNCTVSGNYAAWGGGVHNDGSNSSASLTVSNSTISGNSASSAGGILMMAADGGATLTISNGTVSGNSAAFYGGGIFNEGHFGSATVMLTNSTFSGNSAGLAGNSIGNDANPGNATLVIGNTILNAGASGEHIYNSGGTYTSLGYNLSNDNAGGFLTSPGDHINTAPMLGPLQDNGGPTFTHELLSGSPAIDAGDPNL